MSKTREPSKEDTDNSELLWKAIADDDLDEVRRLAKSGVDLDRWDDVSEYTYLTEAIAIGRSCELIRALLEAGADPDRSRPYNGVKVGG
jgi:hypothetical protein